MGINQKPFKIKLEMSNEAKKPNSREVYLCCDIKLPLIVRRPKIGDTFYPYGMKGKRSYLNFLKTKKCRFLPNKISGCCRTEMIFYG